MTEAGAERLQSYIRELKRSGKPWKEIGPTLRGYLEQGVPANPQDGTLARLDDFMGWERGSARDVLDGGTPRHRGIAETPVNDQAVAVMRRIAVLAAETAELLEKGQ